MKKSLATKRLARVRLGELFTARVRYALVGALSFIFVAASVLGTEDDPPGSAELLKFLKEVGFAGLIALLLVFTIEKYARDRHVDLERRLAQNLLKTVYMRHLPEKLIEGIEQLLLEPKFYRRELAFGLELVRSGAHDPFLCARVTTSYDITHAAMGDPEWHVVPVPMRRGGDVHGNSPLSDLRVDGTRWDAETIEGNGRGRGMELEDVSGFARVRVYAGERRKIRYEVSFDADPEGFEIWTNEIQSLGLTVAVRAPLDVEVDAYVTGLPESARGSGTSHTESRWEFPQSILPGQSVVVSWRRSQVAAGRGLA